MAVPSIYRGARYLGSSPGLRGLPPDTGFEVAFAGRSNSGKSSTLNALTGQRGLARTSKTPGRTQLLNVFCLDPQRRLVDLPGYGFARVPPQVRRHWQRGIEGYLRGRGSLRGLLLITDARRPLGQLDREFLSGIVGRPLRLHVLLNKADKLNRGAAIEALRSVQSWLRGHAPEAGCQLFSATENLGLELLCATLNDWFELGICAAAGALHDAGAPQIPQLES